MKTIRHLFRGNIRQYGMVIALVFLVVLFQITTGGLMLTPMNITNLMMQTSYIHIMAIGMILVIITGYVDLSVGSVVAATGACCAVLMINMGVPVALGIPIILLLGLIMGSAQGFIISVLKIPPFITTLAGMLIFRGVCQVILRGESKGPFPSEFTNIAKGYVSYKINLPEGNFLVKTFPKGVDIVPLLIGLAIIVLLIFLELINRRSKQKYNLEIRPLYFSIAKVAIMSVVIGYISVMLSRHNGMPIILCVIGGLAVIYSLIMQNTIIGRHIYSVGGNQDSARLSGINVASIKFIVYANMGLLAAFAGIIVAGRLDSATPRAGDGFELDAMAACYVGGASTSGGIGTIAGAIVGAMVMGILNNGMSLMGLPIDWQRIIKGLVLLVAVFFDLYAKKKSANA